MPHVVVNAAVAYQTFAPILQRAEKEILSPGVLPATDPGRKFFGETMFSARGAIYVESVSGKPVWQDNLREFLGASVSK